MSQYGNTRPQSVKGSIMIVCVLLVSNSLGCYLATLGDNKACWYPGSTRIQGINRVGIEPVCMEYSVTHMEGLTGHTKLNESYINTALKINST